MTRTYTIHINSYNFSLLSMPNYKKIPNNACTQYAYEVYPSNPITPKTHDGFAPRPTIQRKTTKDTRTLDTIQSATVPVAQTTKNKRSKFRKNIDKEALAQYFDNDVLPSHKEVAQENLDTWLMQTAFELERLDIQKAELEKKEQEELRKFVESSPNTSRFTENTFTYKYNIGAKHDIDEAAYDPWAEIAEYAHDLDWLEDKLEMEQRRANKHIGINSIDATAEDKFVRLFFANEINASVVNRFVQKYNGADTSAAMRTLDKQQRHTTKIARLLYQLQITK